MAKPILEVRAVVKQFGQVRALDGVSFAVTEGEVFGLLGPNGAGKTTLLSVVACLLEPTGGEARILDLVARRRDRDLRRHIGLVPQELAIYGELTARENLLFFGGLYGMRGAALTESVAEVLRIIGLEDRGDERVATFSGGMKRRLNLGAALVHRPRLLLLDEPTTGVDPQSRNRIFEEVKRLNGGGMTVVYTSHYMEEVQALCTRIGIIDHGRLIACDTLPNLLRQLPGLIRFRTPQMRPGLRERLKQLPNARLVENNGACELESEDIKGILMNLLSAFKEEQVELTGLEIEEPNLERVFLHLTGRGLRD